MFSLVRVVFRGTPQTVAFRTAEDASRFVAFAWDHHETCRPNEGDAVYRVDLAWGISVSPSVPVHAACTLDRASLVRMAMALVFARLPQIEGLPAAPKVSLESERATGISFNVTGIPQAA